MRDHWKMSFETRQWYRGVFNMYVNVLSLFKLCGYDTSVLVLVKICRIHLEYTHIWHCAEWKSNVIKTEWFFACLNGKRYSNWYVIIVIPHNLTLMVANRRISKTFLFDCGFDKETHFHKGNIFLQQLGFWYCTPPTIWKFKGTKCMIHFTHFHEIK